MTAVRQGQESALMNTKKGDVQVVLLQLQQISIDNMRVSLPKIQQYFMRGCQPVNTGLWNILQEKVLSLVKEN